MSLRKEDAKRLLQRQISSIQELKTKNHDAPEFEPWRQQTLRIIKKVFGEKSDQAKQFDSIGFGLIAFSSETPDSAWQEAYIRGVADAEATLKSFIDELDLFDQAPSLACPKCNSPNVTFLEITEVRSRKYSLAFPQIAGAEWQTGKKVAYFSCNSCKSVFYTEPFKQG